MKFIKNFKADYWMLFISVVVLLSSTFSEDTFHMGVCYLTFSMWFIGSLILDELRKLNVNHQPTKGKEND